LKTANIDWCTSGMDRKGIRSRDIHVPSKSNKPTLRFFLTRSVSQSAGGAIATIYAAGLTQLARVWLTCQR